MSAWWLFLTVPAGLVLGTALGIGTCRLVAWSSKPGRLPRYNRFMAWAMGWKDEPL